MFDRTLMNLEGMRPVMGALVILALVQAACIIGQAYLLGQVVSQLWSGMAVEGCLPQILAFLACFALLHLVRFSQDTMLDRYSIDRACEIRDGILKANFEGSTILSERCGAAIVTTTASEGIDEAQAYIRIIPPKVVGMAAISLPVLAAMFAFDWVSGTILAVMLPVTLFFMTLLGRQAKARAERQYSFYTRLSNRFMDALRGLDVAKAFGAEDYEAKSVYKHSERLRHATIRTLSSATLSSAVLDLCATFGVAAVAMMLAFRLMDGSMQLGFALSALVLAPEFFSPIRAFASDFHASMDGKNSLAAALEMGAGAPMVESCVSACEEAPAWGKGHAIELRDVSFKYENGGIGPVSLSARGFDRIALVGKSGAGKSTLASIMAGFLEPSGGTVEIDGKVVDLTSPSWNGQVRYIPQHPYLFHATLLENIRFYVPDAPMDAVLRAVDAVGLSSLVSELPEGLMTVIGKGERGLSGGQAHRVALARILLDDNARVLVFDEPTAHLDIETELELKPYMLAAMEGKLVFFATHRMHWTRDMDRVVNLADGRIADQHEVNRDVSALHEPSPGNETCHSSARELRPAREEAVNESAQVGFPSWFSRFILRYKRPVAVALLLGLAALASSALLMFTSGYLISATAQPGVVLFSVMVPVALVQVFGIGRPFARYLERLVSHDWVLKITSDLRLSLYRGIEERIGDSVREREAGEYLGILSDDIGHLQNLYLRVAFPTATTILLAIGATAMFAASSLPFAFLVFVVFAVTAIALPVAALCMTRERSIKVKQARFGHFERLADDVSGSIDWVLANRGSEVSSRHAAYDSTIRADEAKVRLTERCISLSSTLLLGTASCLVIAWAGWHFAPEFGTENWIAAYTLGFFPLIDSFSALPSALSQVPSHVQAIRRLDEYVVDDSQNCGAGHSKGTEPASGGCDIPGDISSCPAIEFSDVIYAYPNSTRTSLDGMTLSIPQGQSVAILGSSGAGKSTLVQVARGLLECDSGHARVLGSLPGSCTSHFIGVLGQHPYLFNRSLRENLTLGVLRATDEGLVRILCSVGLKEKLDSLPNGLDTIVGETGSGFSGGEAHRIALARVLVADTPIVLVDEPFSALDPDTERSLLITLFEACANKTLVVITHHLAEVERFDRIVFIESGKVELDGSPEELKQSSPRFRQLLAFDGAQEKDEYLPRNDIALGTGVSTKAPGA